MLSQTLRLNCIDTLDNFQENLFNCDVGEFIFLEPTEQGIVAINTEGERIGLLDNDQSSDILEAIAQQSEFSVSIASLNGDYGSLKCLLKITYGHSLIQ